MDPYPFSGVGVSTKLSAHSTPAGPTSDAVLDVDNRFVYSETSGFLDMMTLS